MPVDKDSVICGKPIVLVQGENTIRTTCAAWVVDVARHETHTAMFSWTDALGEHGIAVAVPTGEGSKRP